MAVRYATRDDITRLAEIHQKSLPDDLLVAFGQDFLSRVFFPKILASEHATTFVVEEENTPQAFAIFTRQSETLTQELLSDKCQLIRYLFRQLLVNPRILLKIANFLSRKTEGGAVKDAAELFLIAVHPERQGNGYGAQLVRVGCEAIAESEVCVVKTSLEKARRFYQRCGFTDIGVERRGRQQFFVLQKKLMSSR